MSKTPSLNNALAKIESSKNIGKRKFTPNVSKALSKQTIPDVSKKTDTKKSEQKKPKQNDKNQRRDAKDFQSRYIQSYSIFESGVGCVERREREARAEKGKPRSHSVVTSLSDLKNTENHDFPVPSTMFLADVKQNFSDAPLVMSGSEKNPKTLDPHATADLSAGCSRKRPYSFFDFEEGNGRLFTLRLPDKVLNEDSDLIKEGHFGKIQLLDDGSARLVVGEAKFELLSAKSRNETSNVLLIDEDVKIPRSSVQGAEKSVPNLNEQNSPVALNCLGHIEASLAAVPELQQFTRLGR